LSADHNIHLRYDNSGNASGEGHQNIFRILYWAAFIGKTTIVEHIIRLGYSPYIKAYDQQNAIMGAVEGGSLEVINLILSFNYVPTNLQKFQASKEHRDARGNNPMHLAYKLMHKDI
jgi:ankyrin repeat protein